MRLIVGLDVIGVVLAFNVLFNYFMAIGVSPGTTEMFKA